MVKFFRAKSVAKLETLINDFLGDDYVIATISIVKNGDFYFALVGYTAVPETTETGTTETEPAAGGGDS